MEKVQHAKKKKMKIWHKLIDICEYFTVWLHVFSSINFWITSFINVFLLFKSKNLFDLKSIGRNYCRNIDISFFLCSDVITLPGLHNCLYVLILTHPPDVCNKWNLKLRKNFFIPFWNLQQKVRRWNEILSSAFILKVKSLKYYNKKF